MDDDGESQSPSESRGNQRRNPLRSRAWSLMSQSPSESRGNQSVVVSDNGKWKSCLNPLQKVGVIKGLYSCRPGA